VQGVMIYVIAYYCQYFLDLSKPAENADFDRRR